MEDSADTLLSFINNVSSSVKTVLSKPGNFKRNTNHRRFLQKQLKLNCQALATEKSDRKVTREKLYSLNKICGRVSSGDMESVAHIHKKSLRSKNFFEQSTLRNASLVKGIQTNEIAENKDALHEDEVCQVDDTSCLTPLSNYSPSPVPSPTYDHNEIVKDELDSFYADCFYEEAERLHSCRAFTMSTCMPLELSTTDFSSAPFNARGLPSPSYPFCTPSSAVDLRSPEFLSGEDLVNSLNISDLFVPCREDLTDRGSSFPNAFWPISEHPNVSYDEPFCDIFSTSYFGQPLQNLFQAHCL